jgi:hypothetical protein
VGDFGRGGLFTWEGTAIVLRPGGRLLFGFSETGTEHAAIHHNCSLID